MQSISPGVVKTEFFHGFPDDGLKETIDTFPGLKAEDIAEAVMYVLSTGPGVHVRDFFFIFNNNNYKIFIFNAKVPPLIYFH